MMVPGTAQRVPGTGMRTAAGQRGMLGTARLRTGMAAGPGNVAAVGVGMQTAVNVSDRPVTQQGMSGMKTAGQGPGRQVQDPSYYIGVLRAKLTEIATEISKLKREINQHQTDSAQYSGLERKYEELLKEVRNLEGTLADYNLAMDKVRMHTDPTEVEAYQKQLAAKNRRDAQEVDQVFLRKQGRDRATREAEEEVERIHRANEQKLNRLEPAKLSQYKALLDRSHQLQARAHEQQEALDQALGRAAEAEAELRERGHNDRYKDLQRRLDRLRRDRQGLLEEQELAAMDPREANKKVLARVKEDNRRAAELDQKARALREEIGRLRRQLGDLSADLTAKEGADSAKTKYERLSQRDQEMTQFIAKFDETKAQIVGGIQNTQDTIVGLLEHISRGLGAESNMPSADKLDEMKDEARFKEKQLETSQMTMARLRQEKEKRLQEMEKINTLDDKIAEELRGLNDQMGSMRREMGAFEDLDGLRAQAEKTKKYLHEMMEKYQTRQDNVKQQVAQLSAQYEQVKNDLSNNKTHETLEALEKKIAAQANSIFSLQEYIETKGRETDFESLKDDCLRITESLNQITIKMEQNAESGAKYSASGY